MTYCRVTFAGSHAASPSTPKHLDDAWLTYCYFSFGIPLHRNGRGGGALPLCVVYYCIKPCRRMLHPLSTIHLVALIFRSLCWVLATSPPDIPGRIDTYLRKYLVTPSIGNWLFVSRGERDEADVRHSHRELLSDEMCVISSANKICIAKGLHLRSRCQCLSKSRKQYSGFLWLQMQLAGLPMGQLLDHRAS